MFKYISFFILILFPLSVFAQNVNKSSDSLNINFSQSTNLDVSVGLSPESKFYFLKKWKEGIDLFLTFNQDKKAEKMLAFSDKRLAEYGQLLDKGNIARAGEILQDYESQVAQLQDYLEKAKKAKKNVDEVSAKVSERIVKHQEVLSRVYQKVPEPAKEALKNVLQKSADKLPGFLERLTNPEVYSGAINKSKTIKNQIQNTLTNENFQGF